MVWMLLGLGCTNGPQDPAWPTGEGPTLSTSTETDTDTETTTSTTTSTSCEADLANDPAHCGACGVSCLGGACFDGTCELVPLMGGDDWSTFAVKGNTVGACTSAALSTQAIGPDGPGDQIVFNGATACSTATEDGFARVWLDGNRAEATSWDGTYRTYSAPVGWVSGLRNVMWRGEEACFQWMNYPQDLYEHELRCMDPAGGPVRTWVAYDGHDLWPSELYGSAGQNWIRDGLSLYEIEGNGTFTPVADPRHRAHGARRGWGLDRRGDSGRRRLPADANPA